MRSGLAAFLIWVAVFLSFPSAHAAPFEDIRGRAYVLVLTGPVNDPLYIEQLAALRADAETLKGRSVVALHFKDKVLETLDDLSSFEYSPQVLRNRSSALADYYEKFLQTDDDFFSLVLVGQEGRIYSVWPEPVKLEAIYHLMDHPPPLEAP